MGQHAVAPSRYQPRFSQRRAVGPRRAPLGPACLKDVEVEIDFAAETTPNDVVSVIATEPLTADEQWDVYERGEWRLWQLGEVIACGKVDVPIPSSDATMVSPADMPRDHE